MRLTTLTTLLILTCPLGAADWPGWRGSGRTGLSSEKGLLTVWSRGGPKLLWTTKKLGMGYSSPAVVGPALYVLGTAGGKEHLFAFATADGKLIWKAEIGGPWENDRGDGPRSTPTVVGDHVYALGSQGTLLCVEAKSGKVIWQLGLRKDLGGAAPTWGYSESPLVDGDRVIVTPGGKRGALAALDRKTGKALWRSAGWADAADYASPVVGTAQGRRQYVQMASQSVAGVDAATGKLLWRFERDHQITVSTPITSGGRVYVASGYSVGSTLLEPAAAGGVKEVYSSRNMQNHHGGVILLDGHLFGYCDRNGWTCQKLADGSVVWKSNKLGKGSMTYADGHFYCYAEDGGTVALVEASKLGWKEKGRFTVPSTSSLERPGLSSANVWTHPVVANGRLYLRDQECLFCYDVKGKGTR